MELVSTFVDLVLHLDTHLAVLLAQYGGWIYGLLFLIVFCETGLVVTPFLPGDSLLFVAGTLAAGGGLDVGLVATVLLAAAVLGDSANYAIGGYFGHRVFDWEHSRLFNRAAFDRAHAFYERHGGKTIIIARFLPLIRTFAPFVAGVAEMSYRRFLAFNVAGGALWIGLLVFAGYWFGNLPVIRNNLSAVIVAIIGVSLLPLAVAWLRGRTPRTNG